MPNVYLLEGFDGYGTDMADCRQKYWTQDDTSWILQSTDARTGKCLRADIGGNSRMRLLAGGPVRTTLVVGLAWRPAGYTSTQVIGVGQGGVGGYDNIHVNLYSQEDGRFMVCSTDGYSPAVLSTAFYSRDDAPLYVEMAWNYIELKVVVDTPNDVYSHNFTGYIEVRLNQVPIITAPNAATSFCGNGRPPIKGYTFAQIRGGNGAPDDLFDDLYLADDFLGDIRVDTHFPNVDGATEEWTRSTGNDSYALLDDGSSRVGAAASQDGDTTYISSTTLNQITRVGVENFKGTGTIQAVSMHFAHRKTDAGASGISPVWYQTTNTVRSQRDSSTGYRYDEQVEVTQPEGGAWNSTAFNALEVGVKKTE